MARRDYGPLRDAHRRALDDLNAEIDKSKHPARDAGTTDAGLEKGQQTEVAPDGATPERPEGEPWRSPGWTHEGGMVEQQASALRWVRASYEHRQDQQPDAADQVPHARAAARKEFEAAVAQPPVTAEARRAAREALNRELGTDRTGAREEPGLTTEPKRDNDIER